MVVPLRVTSISPSSGQASQFTITFNPTPPGADASTWNYTGTYSYLIAPNDFTGLGISSPVESYISFSGTLTNNSDLVTNVSNPEGLVNGETISGPGIQAGTTIGVNPTPFAGTLTNGSALVTGIHSTTGLVVGETVTGIGIPTGTTIQIVGSSTITLSAAATVSGLQGLVATDITLSLPATTSGTENLLVLRTFDPGDQNPGVTPQTLASKLSSFLSQYPTLNPYELLSDVYTVPSLAPINVLNPTVEIDSNTLPIIVPGPQVLGSDPGISFAGTLTSGSETVTNVLSAAGVAGEPGQGLVAGQVVTGTGIPLGTTIVSVNPVTGVATLSGDATASGSEDLVAIDSSSLITDGTANTLNVTFDRPMQVSTFTPSEVDQIMGPTGSLMGPQYFPSTTSTTQIIPAATSVSSPGVLESTVTIPSYNGTFTIADLSVDLTAAFSPDSDLTAVLISPTGTQVTLFSGVGGNGSNFINTAFDGSASNSITTGAAPFTGSYRPAQSLSAFNGQTVDMQNPLASTLWVPGVWTLKLINSSTSATGMLDNWSLNVTPVITVSPVPSAESTVGGVLLASEFTVGFPLQQLSGTYTIQMGPTIEDQFGDGLDVTQDAGLAVLRSMIGGELGTAGSTTSSTTTAQYSASSAPGTIATTTGGMTFTGTLTMGSALVTGIASTTGLFVGQTVTGNGIPPATTIEAITSLTSITLSSPDVTAAGPETLTAAGFTGTLTSGSSLVTGIASTAGLLAGEPITGIGIPFGTTIEAVDGLTSITLSSANVTSSGTQVLNASGMTSSITVPDSFIISGDKTAAGLSVIQVQLNVSFAADPDLTATLTHYDSDGNLLGTTTLFSGVGAGSRTANFANTIFDDNSATPIQNGSAPFSGTYDPQKPLATYSRRPTAKTSKGPGC